MNLLLLALNLGILIQFGFLSWRVSLVAYRRSHQLPYLLILPIWFAFTFWLSVHGFFSVTGFFLPNDVAGANFLCFLALAPIVLFFIQLRHSESLNEFIRTVPSDRLVTLQSFRAMGVVFWVLTYKHQLPGVLGIPVGIIDLLIGLSAFFMGRFLIHDPSRARPWVMRWNILGLAGFAYCALIFILCFPWPALPLRLTPLLKVATPPVLIGFYPLAFLVVFAMPLSIILHLLSFRSARHE